jgi:hypothetical protein
VAVVAFAVAWWLGLYLLARGGGRVVPCRAGLGLLGFALALPVDELWPTGPVHGLLLCLPAVLWTGVLVRLLPEPLADTLDPWWRRVLLPVTAVAAVAGSLAGSVAMLVVAALVLVPLMVAVWLLVRHRTAVRPDGVGELVAVALLLCALPSALLLFGLRVWDHELLLVGMAVDLAVLGVGVAVLDAFGEGEAVRRDMLFSALVAGGTAVLFGGQVLVAGGEPRLLLYGVVAAAIAVQVLARPLSAVADRLAFRAVPALRRTRTELREVADALPKRNEAIALAELDDAEFTRLTRRALSGYGDLGKLVASPLTALPAIDARLAARGAQDTPLERARELKAVLADGIARLKPAGDDFGTSEEWRHYNALHFYYVAGVRPYSVRTKVTELDPVARRALSWFADHVPERTLHNWQAAAARVLAADLRATLPMH